VPKARSEPGCVSIDAYRSTSDPRLFWICSRWVDEAAFDVHAGLGNTNRFVERMETLIDHPFDAKRATVL
jgi:quinol monooxygenase YgiN